MNRTSLLALLLASSALPLPAQDHPIAAELLGADASAPPKPAPAPKSPRVGAVRAARRRPAAPPELVVSTIPISIAFPPEGLRLDARSSFIFGAVSHPLRSFRINGSTVTVHRKGGFLAYLPLSPGQFAFVCELDLPGGTTSLTRLVQVRGPASSLPPGAVGIVPDGVTPSDDAELRAGDWLTVRARATPGLSASFALSSSREEHPMPESAPGAYEGAYQVRSGDAFSSAEILVTLRRANRVVARQAAKGRLSTPQTPPQTAVVRSPTAYLRSGPDLGFTLFPAPGTRLLTSSRVEGWTKAQLTPSLSGWIEERNIERLPAGTPPPAATLGTIRAVSGAESTLITLDLSQAVPFAFEESPSLDRLTLRLYYTQGHTNWVIYDDSDAFLQEVRWEQRGSDVVEVTAYLKPGRTLWGYDAVYSPKDRALRVELRHPPAIAARPSSPLAGRTIVIDPGHSPVSPGSIGPHGVLEADANWALAKDLETMLRAEGAQPVLTRASADEDASLGERTRLAWNRRGDILVSVHNNALPDGENPFERPHGHSVFYYHHHSLALARSVHEAYLRLAAPLPSEGLRYGNLYVARATQMPSILTESAYLMFPEQEDILLTPAKRRVFARAMLEGIRRFLEGERARQAAAGLPSAAARPVMDPKTAARAALRRRPITRNRR